MDHKLKALKVADLRALLATAHVPVPAKATKPDLIARIQASQPALAAYAALYPPDDLLAPPEEVDWSVEQPDHVAEPEPAPAAAPVVVPVVAPASPPKPAPTPKPADQTTDGADPPAAPVDPELEKRRLRAARFGVPFVEPKPKLQSESQPKKRAAKPARATSPKLVDPKKLDERAARFGIKPAQPPADSAPKSRKRPAPPPEQVDAEELERRKKRAERFGVPTKP